MLLFFVAWLTIKERHFMGKNFFNLDFGIYHNASEEHIASILMVKE
jgi:hypothetical protein